MARLQSKRLDRPDEVRSYPLGRTEVFQLDDFVVGRMTMDPGWRWAEHVRPLAGTERCLYHHFGVVLSGCLRVQLDDGSTRDLRANEAFEIPPGHDAWVVGDEPWVAIDVAGARAYARPVVGSGETALGTLVFADIVDSTATLARVGDAVWREMLSEYYARMQTQLDRYRGREVDRAGDALLALFDGTARAVECAAAMCAQAAKIGLATRVGVHTGEVELVPGGVRGVAVHMAARIAAHAASGEVLVSATTRELLAGSRLAFESRGSFPLKGLPGDRELFALVRS